MLRGAVAATVKRSGIDKARAQLNLYFYRIYTFIELLYTSSYKSFYNLKE